MAITKNKGSEKMALIYCPQCGQSVSDKATVCPHCGSSLSTNTVINTSVIKCEDCGAEYDVSLSTCPKCGCPNTSKPLATKKKKHTGLIVSLIVVAALIVVGTVGFFVNQKIEAAKYYDNMESVTYLMLNGAADAETAGNLIKSVWFNAIYQEKDAETDKYTIINGKFVDDFNDALSNLFSDSDFVANISKVQDNQDQVTNLMKQLKNPPKAYEEAYGVLKVYYDNYLKMTKMVINPTGSLNTFSDDFNNIDTETVNSFEKMKLYLD